VGAKQVGHFDDGTPRAERERMKLITPALFLAAVASLAPATALADDKAANDAVTVDVDVVDTARKQARTVTFSLGLAEQGTCAEASSDDGTTDYVLKVCRGRGDASAPTLELDLSRRARGKSGESTGRVRVSAKLAAGKRAVIGKLAAGDDAIEIAATVTR
jgi:hypothetical protein